MGGESVAVVLILLLWFFGAVIPAKIASDRGVAGHPVLWWVASLFLWPLTLLLALFQKPDLVLLEKKQLSKGDSKKCPKCAEIVKSDAVICRFCSYQFPATPPADQRACPKCKEFVMHQAVRCRHCGYSLTSSP